MGFYGIGADILQLAKQFDPDLLVHASDLRCYLHFRDNGFVVFSPLSLKLRRCPMRYSTLGFHKWQTLRFGANPFRTWKVSHTFGSSPYLKMIHVDFPGR